jgi:hypothetical protein
MVSFVFLQDAIPPEDNDYASVQDALPAGKVVRILSIRKPPEYKPEYGQRTDDNVPLIGHAGITESSHSASRLEVPVKSRRNRQMILVNQKHTKANLGCRIWKSSFTIKIVTAEF